MNFLIENIDAIYNLFFIIGIIGLGIILLGGGFAIFNYFFELDLKIDILDNNDNLAVLFLYFIVVLANTAIWELAGISSIVISVGLLIAGIIILLKRISKLWTFISIIFLVLSFSIFILGLNLFKVYKHYNLKIDAVIKEISEDEYQAFDSILYYGKITENKILQEKLSDSGFESYNKNKSLYYHILGLNSDSLILEEINDDFKLIVDAYKTRNNIEIFKPFESDIFKRISKINLNAVSSNSKINSIDTNIVTGK
ncbi:MAG: hypothetical protein DRJ07_10225 [Bacteroidetes bacterium]|nr:MAG: hypothetical protein DRJ07_10225 [Bacteroidota bacterium]